MRCRGAEFAESGALVRGRLHAYALALLVAVSLPAASSPKDDGVAMAEPAPLVRKSLLLDIAVAGTRIVAVGDRGHVVLSDDGGVSWIQARTVPTRNLLTGVCFSNAKQGIAVGHDEITLVTRDGGETWERTHYAPEAQQPLLDVWCGASGKAIAVGAYGSYYESTDGGASWKARRLDAKPAVSKRPATEDLGDPHLNRIVPASSMRLYLAGEAGHLYRSDDAGTTWLELPSPYEGSFFGLLPLSDDAVLAYGLRGHLYRSADAGLTWTKIETGTTAMLNDATRLDTQDFVVVGLSGTLLESHDAGHTFAMRVQLGRKGLSAVLGAGGSEVIVAGEDGIRRITLAGEAP